MAKQAITLKIAGKSYPFNIESGKEEIYRLAEREVNNYLALIKQQNIKNCLQSPKRNRNLFTYRKNKSLCRQCSYPCHNFHAYTYGRNYYSYQEPDPLFKIRQIPNPPEHEQCKIRKIPKSKTNRDLKQLNNIIFSSQDYNLCNNQYTLK